MTRGSWLRLVLLASIWGSSFLFIALALEGLAPMQIVLGRLLGATVVLGGIIALQRRRLPRRLVIWGHLALMGVVGNIIPFSLFSWAEQHISSGLAGVLNGTTPLFTLAFSVVALAEERLDAARVVGLLVGFAGVVLVVGPWESASRPGSLAGQLAALGAAAGYGVAFTYARRFVAGRGHPPLVLALVQLGTAALILTLASPLVASSPVALTPTVVGSVVALGAVGTGLAYLLFYRLIGDAGATNASMVTYFIPIVAVTLGVVVLGEPLTWNLFAGAAVVITGVAVVEGRMPWLRRRPLAVPEGAAPPARGAQ